MTSESRAKKIRRAIIVLFWVIVLAFAVFIYVSDPVEGDIYGWLTHGDIGFHCPACGMTRAVYYTMRFDIGKAFYYHAYFVVTMPVLGYILIALTVDLWVWKVVIPYPKGYWKWLWVIFGGWMAFTIIRNFVEFIY